MADLLGFFYIGLMILFPVASFILLFAGPYYVAKKLRIKGLVAYWVTCFLSYVIIILILPSIAMLLLSIIFGFDLSLGLLLMPFGDCKSAQNSVTDGTIAHSLSTVFCRILLLAQLVLFFLSIIPPTILTIVKAIKDRKPKK